MEKTARYIKKYHAEEMARVKKAADNMVNNTILFDLRWDMEQTQVPVAFEDEIDWLHQPSGDPEWTFALNRMQAWICMGQAYAVTDDEQYPKAFARQLLHWVDTVRLGDLRSANAWRTIETGMRIGNWLKAYQYMNGSPHVTDEVTAALYKSIAEHAEFLMTVWNSFNLMSNWGILANHGLFLAGCMMPQTDRTREYVGESLRRLADAVEIQVYPDGVHWEQSPLYHNEMIRCLLDVIIYSERYQIDMPTVIREKTKAMLYASLAAGKPNGHEIMMGDSDDVDQRDLITLGACVFSDGLLKFGGYPRLDIESLWALGHDAIEAYERIVPTAPDQIAQEFPDSGNFYSRTGWKPDAIFVHFHCGTLGAGHGHADKLHFDLFSNGEDILLDSGRYTYMPKPDRFSYKLPQSHNTITVDGTDLYACIDSWECKNLSRAVGQKFLERDSYVYMEGAHLGYIGQGIYVSRRIIHIRPDILLICDSFDGSDDRKRTCRQYFQWNNQGQVTGEGEHWAYRSGKNTARLVLCSEQELDAGLLRGRISRHYNQQEDAARLETRIDATGFATVFSVIAIDSPGSEDLLEVQKEDVHSNFKGTVFSPRDIEALTITKGHRRYTAVIAHREYASPTDTFTAAGCVGFGQALVFDRCGAAPKGTVLLY